MHLFDSVSISELPLQSSFYPVGLKNIPTPPRILYCKGALDSFSFDNCLGIVGSRNMSPYGARVIKTFIKELSHFDVTVVSGFSPGVDRCAHKEALLDGLPTVAILPYGIDHSGSRETLYTQNRFLSEGGLFISEYAGEDPPRKWMFSKRNRIIAGICKCLLVIEAAVNSGSLITANYARKFNKQVYAVPGNIFEPNSKGITQILASFAKAIDSSCSVSSYMRVGMKPSLVGSTETSPINSYNQDGMKGRILMLLSSSGMRLDDLSLALSVSISTLSSKLTQLQLEGVVREWGGKFYVS